MKPIKIRLSDSLLCLAQSMADFLRHRKFHSLLFLFLAATKEFNVVVVVVVVVVADCKWLDFNADNNITYLMQHCGAKGLYLCSLNPYQCKKHNKPLLRRYQSVVTSTKGSLFITMSHVARQVLHRTYNSKLHFAKCYLITLRQLLHFLCSYKKN